MLNERRTIASVETVALFYAKRHLNRKTCDGFPARDGAALFRHQGKGALYSLCKALK
jgi:hypothetical protein